MNSKVLLIAALCGLVVGRPSNILQYDTETHSRTESGKPGVAVRGEYRFIEDGKEYKVAYVADEEGFRAEGEHLPDASEFLKILPKSEADFGRTSVRSEAVSKQILNYDAETHSRAESGVAGESVKGEYSFLNDGKEYKVTYVADDAGFRASGNHIPVAGTVTSSSTNTVNVQKTVSSNSANAAPTSSASPEGEILKYDAGTHSRSESGSPGVAVRGEYRFNNDDKEYRVTYVADDDGFRAMGDHIPVAEFDSQKLVEVAIPQAASKQQTAASPREILNYDAETHSRQESGIAGVAVEGEYRFQNEGNEYKVKYVADDQGFRAEGDHILVPFESAKVAPTIELTRTVPVQASAPAVAGATASKAAVILNYDADTHSRFESGAAGVSVSGHYKYQNEGQDYKVTYVADDQGFRADGDLVPAEVTKESPAIEIVRTVPASPSAAKTSADVGVILNYDAETHSRFETGEPGVSVSGSFRYQNDGKEFKVNYVADDQGFRAEGDHILVPFESAKVAPAIEVAKTVPAVPAAAAEVVHTAAAPATTKTSADAGTILNYDAETHSRLETGVPGVSVAGHYKYQNDGKEYQVTYVADDQGFKAEGDHVLVPFESAKVAPAIEVAKTVPAVPAAAAEVVQTAAVPATTQTSTDAGTILNYDAETHSRFETGVPGVSVAGHYKYQNDGKEFKVNYVADDQGFRAEGDHILVPLESAKVAPAIEVAKTVPAVPSAAAEVVQTAAVPATSKTSADAGTILNYDAETHSRFETGVPGVSVSGNYKYQNDGKEYQVTYVADDQGFKAEGDHIPVPFESAKVAPTIELTRTVPVQASAPTVTGATASKAADGVILNYDADTHSRFESGVAGVSVSGHYKYQNEGKDYKVTYVADDQGFRADGDTIPVKVAKMGPAVEVVRTVPALAVKTTSADAGEILNYDAETHSRVESGISGVSVKGQYQFEDQGKLYKVSYVADDQGFRAEGDHLPMSPAVIPMGIAAADTGSATAEQTATAAATPEAPAVPDSSKSVVVASKLTAEPAVATQVKAVPDCDTHKVLPSAKVLVPLNYHPYPLGFYLIQTHKY